MKYWCVTGIVFAESAGELISLLGEVPHTALSVLVLRKNYAMFQEKKESSNMDKVAFWF